MSSQNTIDVSAPPSPENEAIQSPDIFEMKSAATTLVNLLQNGDYEISQIGVILRRAQQALETTADPALLKSQLHALIVVAQSRQEVCKRQVGEALNQADYLDIALEDKVNEAMGSTEDLVAEAEGQPHH